MKLGSSSSVPEESRTKGGEEAAGEADQGEEEAAGEAGPASSTHNLHLKDRRTSASMGNLGDKDVFGSSSCSSAEALYANPNDEVGHRG